MIEVEVLEPNKRPSLPTIIRANIRFWIWADMHGPRFQGKEIIFGFRKPPIKVYGRTENAYFISWEIVLNRKPKLGVQVPMLTIVAYERATNSDTSLIWK